MNVFVFSGNFQFETGLLLDVDAGHVFVLCVDLCPKIVHIYLRLYESVKCVILCCI